MKLDESLLKKYAQVMVLYALDNGKGINKGDTVLLVGQECSKALYVAIAKEIYARLSFSMREYPIPEASGIQNALDSLGHPNARNVKPAGVMDSSLIEEVRKSGFIDKLYGRAPMNQK